MRILVGGVYADGLGYPNGRNTIQLLRDRARLQVIDCAKRLASEESLWKLTTRSRTRMILFACRTVFACIQSLWKILRATERSADIVYVPYPSLPFMLLVSLLPRCWRPRCVVDACILVWDTVVNDRRLLGEASVGAKLLRFAERRSLRVATSILVDTQAHKELLCSSYKLARNTVKTFPLAIDEPAIARESPDDEKKTWHGPLRVLFVGTFVPLQGTKLIARAINRLKDDASIKFRVIGDGQDSPIFAAETSSCLTNLIWHRKWMDKDELLKEIGDSDVCLGIFGNSAKAARVLPLKIYLYAACGKAVISQNRLSLPEDIPIPPMALVDANDETALVQALKKLASEPECLAEMGTELAKYYRCYLSNEMVVVRWEELLQQLLQSTTT